jgi:hypothetical protein
MPFNQIVEGCNRTITIAGHLQVRLVASVRVIRSGELCDFFGCNFQGSSRLQTSCIVGKFDAVKIVARDVVAALHQLCIKQIFAICTVEKFVELCNVLVASSFSFHSKHISGAARCTFPPALQISGDCRCASGGLRRGCSGRERSRG